MNPTIAVAPAPRNLMQDIAPSRPAQPLQTAPASVGPARQEPASSFSVMQAPQAAPQPEAQVAAAPVIVPAPAPLHQNQPHPEAAHFKSTTPVLVIVIAMVVTAALVFAALYVYQQGS